MMRMKKILLVLALTVLGAAGWQAVRPVTAEAETLADVVKSAPKGIPLSDRVNANNVPGFDIDKDKEIKNQVIFQKANGANNAGTGVSILTQAGQFGLYGRYGAFWSNRASLDLKKDFKTGMWVYITGAANKTGAGMAFVLRGQDPEEVNTGKLTNRIAFYPGDTVSASPTSNIGVWGLDPGKMTPQTSPRDVAKTAMQNSWALEFDTLKDDSEKTSTQRALDLDLGADVGQHIASGYPGDAATYEVATGGGLFNPYDKYVTMKHAGLITDGSNKDFLSDGNWHHITLEYTAPTGSSTTGSMHYTFDDKNPDTGLAKTAIGDTQTEDIKLSAFGSESKVYWGFTATANASGTTNGTYFDMASENAAVVFEQMPGDAQGDAKATVYREDGTTPLTAKDTITGGEKLQIKYDLKWTKGANDWRYIVASPKMQDDLKVLSAKVTYPDAEISAPDEDFTDSIIAGKIPDFTLKQDLGPVSIIKHGQVTLEVQAENVDHTSSGQNFVSNFTGTTAMASADIPDFNIKKAPLALTVDEDASTLAINQGGTAVVKGQVVSADSSMKNADITVKPVIKGKDGAADVKLDEVKLTNDESSRDFSFDIPSSKLKLGENTLEMTAIDANGEESLPVRTSITMGSVAFGDVSEALNFKAVLTGQSQVLKPNEPLDVNIVDTQTADGQWTVNAKASDLTLQLPGGGNLSGNLIYRDSSGTDQILNGDDTQIATADSVGAGTTTKNLADIWGSDGGIRLAVNSSALSGDYSGAITWELTNAPGTD